MSISPAIPGQVPYRVNAIDLLRGVVMIIMALDHTRDFFHISAITADPLDPATTTLPIYFTRWITHYCAPVFVFLSGISAFLSSRKKTKAQASAFLAKRGLWLILVELTIVTFGITFNPFFNFIILQVIWAIGCSMIILALLSRISYQLVLGVGVILFFGHNLLDYFSLPQDGATGTALLIALRSAGTVLRLDAQHFIGVFYAVLPWTGVMLMGYAAGRIYDRDFSPVKRRKLLMLSGGILIILFMFLRATDIYGNPQARLRGDGFVFNLLAFLNTSKYPPSLQYCCMTLGPALIALALFEKLKGAWVNVVSVYGRVPFFYYILHFYLLHSLLVLLFFATNHSVSEIGSIPFFFRPATFGFGLPLVYAIWISVVAILYRPCKWFSRYKQTHRQWWLQYL